MLVNGRDCFSGQDVGGGEECSKQKEQGRHVAGGCLTHSMINMNVDGGCAIDRRHDQWIMQTDLVGFGQICHVGTVTFGEGGGEEQQQVRSAL